MKSVKRLVSHIIKSQFIYPAIVAIALAAVLFFVGAGFTMGVQNQLTSLFILMVIAVAWNLIGGFGGQFSLGHSIFVGIGAYSSAIILTLWHWPLWPTLFLAAAIAAVIGVVIAFPLLRLRGPYLAIGSLGMTLATYGWMINWDFTKQSSSYAMPLEDLLGVTDLYNASIFLVLGAVLVSLLMVRSPLGKKLIALRDDESGATSLGVRRIRTLIPFWAVSGFLTGLAGVFFALQQGQLTVDAAFDTQFSLDSIIISVIGGAGTLAGPIIGSIVIYYVRFFAADYSNWAIVIEAVVVILVVRFFPRGIMGILYGLRTAIERWLDAE
jgi:branched-chain amino acid transport system permease protein